MTIIGIDPGTTGGIAWLADGEPQARKMPDTEADIWVLLAELESPGCFAVMERVHSSPQMGVTSAFTFGRGYGGLRMALIAAGIPFEDVTPQRWQKELGCLTGGDKNVSKARAQQLYPQLRVTHAIADALLICEYARRLKG